MKINISVVVAVSLALGASGPKPEALVKAAEAEKHQESASATTSAPISGLTLGAIDTEVRPQDDFFKYANGKWLKKYRYPGR